MLVDHQGVRGRQPPDSGEERPVRVVEVGLLEVLPDRAAVGLEAGLRVGTKRPWLAREGEAAIRVAEVERLDAEAVARAEEAPSAAVPECECPHAVEALDALVAPLEV